MKRFHLALAATLGVLTLVGLTAVVTAQRVQAPGNTAIVCAYNASPPTLTTGWFGYAQCDSTGKLITSAGGGGGSAVTIADGADVAEGAIADAAATAGSTGTLSAKLRLITTQLSTVFQTGGALGAGTNRVGYTSDDPCTQKTKSNAAFSTSSGGPVSIVALSGSTVIYICSISAITDTAVKLSFIDGTGGSCASAQHAIWGSTTAASGMSLPDNGGFTQGSGNGSVGVTTSASAFCLLQSGTSLIAGNVSYVQQ